ncbi:MAG: hypothetical protein EON57_18075, partial [Alphaproteobacteria bacterium]
MAIIASLYYVVTTSRSQDLAQADEVVGGLAATEAQKITSFLSGYAAAADSVARTGSALFADPSASPNLYGAVVKNQLASLDGALGVLMMFTPESGLSAQPAFAGSEFIISGNHVGIIAVRGEDGQIAHTSLDSPDPKGYDGWFYGPLKSDKAAISGPNDINGVLYTSFTNIIRDTAGKGVGLTSVAFN